MADRETATGAIGLVQAFVNSVDLEDGPEALTSPEALATWLSDRGLVPAGAAPCDRTASGAAGHHRRQHGRRRLPRRRGHAERGRVGQQASGTIRFRRSGAPRAGGQRRHRCARPDRCRGVRSHGRRRLGQAQAVRLANVPVGVFRPISEPLQPLVHHGIVRQPREGPTIPSRARRPATGTES